MRIWEDQLDFLKYIEKLFGIAWGIMDNKENVIAKFDDSKHCKMEQLWVETIYSEEKSDISMLLGIGENIYIWFFALEEKYYFLGPVSTNQVTSLQIHKFVHQYHLEVDKLNMPNFSLDQLLNLYEFSYYGITGQKFSERQRQKARGASQTINSVDKTEYVLYRVKEEEKRTPYEEELVWFNKIKEGDSREILRESNYPTGLGKLAKNSDYKQLEYIAVSGVTLATRAAIEGGVPPMVAYEASDILLQNISQSKNISQLLETNFNFSQIFTELVCKYKSQKNEGITVELCKEYIAKHLYRKFSIQQMANELAMNRSHMSRKFTEKAGITIQDYIREERLIAAANLLRYSEESVSQISDYMHFSSPSRFSSYFKTKYGISPLIYREKNKLIDFKESRK